MDTPNTRFMDARPGDTVVRNFCGIHTALRVTEVRNDVVIASFWTFDRATGWEVDEELGWGPKHGHSGSRLVKLIPQLDTTDKTC